MYDTKKYNPQYISFTLAAEFTKQFYRETFFLTLFMFNTYRQEPELPQPEGQNTVAYWEHWTRLSLWC